MIAYLALGSNLGDRRSYLESAIHSLSRQGVQIVRSASVYLTEPHEIPNQPWFLNTVVEANTLLGPEQLLGVCQAVEEEHFRKRSGMDERSECKPDAKRKRDSAQPQERAQPSKESRTLDIDIIFYGDSILNKSGLTIPHPRFRNRRFVLEPLAEIAPDFVDPVSGKTVRRSLEAVDDSAEVRYHGPPLL